MTELVLLAPGLSDADRIELAAVAKLLVAQRGLLVRLTALLGGAMERAGAGLAGRVLGPAWQERLPRLVEDALWRGFDAATLGLAPRSSRAAWRWPARAMASVSGVASGFAGLPGLAVDIPVTTALMLRSIAEIARTHGEDIGSDAGKRACLEVFALGGPSRDDDETGIGYWAARVALSQLAVDGLIRQVARLLSVAFSEKLLAQAVPAVGAVAGGGLNYVFMNHYQQMARVHFTLREVERRSGDAAGVRACFDAAVSAARRVGR